MSRCKVCREVSKHLISDAIAGTVTCAKCGRKMDMRDATIEAIAAADRWCTGNRRSLILQIGASVPSVANQRSKADEFQQHARLATTNFWPRIRRDPPP